MQVWMTPDQRGHEPQYGSSLYEPEERKNKLLHVLGGTGPVPRWPTVAEGRCIKLHQGETGSCRAAWLSTAVRPPPGSPHAKFPPLLPRPRPADANVFVSENDAGFGHEIVLGAGRQAYLVCIEGSMAVGDSAAGACAFILHEAVLLLPACTLAWVPPAALSSLPPTCQHVPLPPDLACLAETQLAMRDAAELVADKNKPAYLSLKAGDKGSHFMLIEMQQRS